LALAASYRGASPRAWLRTGTRHGWRELRVAGLSASEPRWATYLASARNTLCARTSPMRSGRRWMRGWESVSDMLS